LLKDLNRLDNISDLCSKKRINLATKEASPIQNIISFQKKIQDQLKSSQGRGEASNSLLRSPEPSKISRSARGHEGADDIVSPHSGVLETPVSSSVAFDRDMSEAGSFRSVFCCSDHIACCLLLRHLSALSLTMALLCSEDEGDAPTQSSSRSSKKGSKILSAGRKNSAKGEALAKYCGTHALRCSGVFLDESIDRQAKT
jgi:hypothetical protein